MANQRPLQARRLLAMYLLTTLVPVASLAWLGWRMADQDRVLEAKRLEEQRDRAADLAATALQRILDRHCRPCVDALGSRRRSSVTYAAP